MLGVGGRCLVLVGGWWLVVLGGGVGGGLGVGGLETFQALLCK